MKGQTGAEFLILLAIMLIISTSIIVYLAGRGGTLRAEEVGAELAEVGNILTTEVSIASGTQNGYQRTFELPVTIAGTTYEMELSNATEISIKTPSNEQIIFLPAPVQLNLSGSVVDHGSLTPGKHLITKSDGKITIS